MEFLYPVSIHAAKLRNKMKSHNIVYKKTKDPILHFAHFYVKKVSFRKIGGRTKKKVLKW